MLMVMAELHYPGKKTVIKSNYSLKVINSGWTHNS